MEMVDSLSQEIFWNNAQVFIDGFCLATKMMAEVYQTQPAAKEKASS